MADFGYDWGSDEEEDEGTDPSVELETLEDTATKEAPAETTGETPEQIAGSLPPGVVVNRVAASDKKANPHGTTESELLEPMIEDKAKQLEVTKLEHGEENLSPLEVFCKRASSVFIFQRVWAAKEVGRLLGRESKGVAMGVLVPIAMRLSDDRELFVRETMAQNLLPVLHYYFDNKGFTPTPPSPPPKDEPAESPEQQQQQQQQQQESSARTSEESQALSDTGSTKSRIVPDIVVPSDEDFGTWLHRLLLTPHPSVSLPAQRAAVALGHRLTFEKYHTEIVHGVILSLVQNPLHQHLLQQAQRSKEMIVKSRPSSVQSAPGGDTTHQENRATNRLSSGLASLFGRRSWTSEKTATTEQAPLEDDEDKPLDRSSTTPSVLQPEQFVGIGDISTSAKPGNGFFVSPADEEARLERTRRKLLMLHMVHLVAVEFGSSMRPAVFVPVVERATQDKAFEVRRDAAAVLGSLAKAVSVDLALDVLFQCFLTLAQDPIWQVRQSAARHSLPGLALVLAVRNERSSGVAASKPEHHRKHSLQWFAKSPPMAPVPTAASHPDLTLSIIPPLDSSHPSDPIAEYMFKNTPSRSVPDKQWLQLVDRLAGPREPSHHVRAAVFESMGKLALALVDCPRTRDALVSLAINDVQRVNGDQGSGKFGLFGSNNSLADLDDEDEELDEETAAAEEESMVMSRALGEIHGSPSMRGRDSGSIGRGASLVGGPTVAGSGRLAKIRAQRAVSKDVIYQCAYNLPALLAALGAQGWDRLRDVYMQLSKAEHYEARRSLACSLHEVARILAAESRQSTPDQQQQQQQQQDPSFSADLESVLCLFLIDGTDIKMGALAHLGDTLTWLTPTSRIRCLPMIMQVFKHDGKQWRTRELMATQLVKLCHLFPASVVVGSLLPQAVEWAHDPVAGVRAAVAPAFPIMFELTKLDPTTQVKFFETVISFSHASTFRSRLFFVEICSALLAHDQDPNADPVDFDQFFLPSLAALAADRVANVRIALARLVRRMLENRMRRQSISATLADMWISTAHHHAGASAMSQNRLPPVADAPAEEEAASSSASEWVDEKTEPMSPSTTAPAVGTARRRSSGSSGLQGIQKRPSRKRSSLSRHRSLSRGEQSNNNNNSNSNSSNTTPQIPSPTASKFYSHRSLGSVARRRRNTTPMRAHLLATIVQQLAKDKDRDVLELVRDLPGLPLVPSESPRQSVANTPTTHSFASSEAESPAPTNPNLKKFPEPPPSPPLQPAVQIDDDLGVSAMSQPVTVTESDSEHQP